MPVKDTANAVRLPVELRGAGLDDWSAVRELHASAFRALAGPTLDLSQVAAFVELIFAPDYTDALLTQDLQTAWYEGHLVATAGWVAADDSGASARITAVYVSPMFQRLGIGRRIVGAAEARARAAGFRSFTARVFPPALPFFGALGYARSSQGALSVGTQNGIPVYFVRKGGGEPSRGHNEDASPSSPHPAEISRRLA